MEKSWKKGIARDAMAFGSILFYIIVIIRAIIGEHIVFVYQVIISLVVLIILSFIIKKANRHIARAVPLGVFTSLFYQDNLFTAFAFLVFVVMIISAFYIKEKKKAIFNGVISGFVASLAGYYLAPVLI